MCASPRAVSKNQYSGKCQARFWEDSRVLETYCRTIRLSPGKSIIPAKWNHQPFEENPRRNCNEKHKYAEKIMAAEILYGLLGNIVGAILGFSCAASTVLHERSKNQNRKREHF